MTETTYLRSVKIIVTFEDLQKEIITYFIPFTDKIIYSWDLIWLSKERTIKQGKVTSIGIQDGVAYFTLNLPSELILKDNFKLKIEWPNSILWKKMRNTNLVTAVFELDKLKEDMDTFIKNAFRGIIGVDNPTIVKIEKDVKIYREDEEEDYE